MSSGIQLTLYNKGRVKGQKCDIVYSNRLAILDVTTAVVIIIVLIVGVIVTNRILHYRRRRLIVTQTAQEANHDNNNNNGGVNTDRSVGGSIIRGLPTIQNKLKLIAALATFIFIIIILAESVVMVQAGHRGVVNILRRSGGSSAGRRNAFYSSICRAGYSIRIRTLKYQADASAASNDLQEVQTVIALNYHIDPNDANVIYQQLGPDYSDRIIAPTIQESVKASVAKFNAEELITKRETAKGVIVNAIRNTLSHRDIIVETVFITDFKFSQAFADQIESKVVAFQKYLTEQNNLRAIQVIANQTVVQLKHKPKQTLRKPMASHKPLRSLISSSVRILNIYNGNQSIDGMARCHILSGAAGAFLSSSYRGPYSKIEPRSDTIHH